MDKKTAQSFEGKEKRMNQTIVLQDPESVWHRGSGKNNRSRRERRKKYISWLFCRVRFMSRVRRIPYDRRIIAQSTLINAIFEPINNSPVKYKAFLFDMNGTMIDDMQYHIQAWHKILNELGAGISMERMKEECYGKNDELLERIFPNRFSAAEKKEMSWEKERQYQESFRPHLKLLDGLPEVLAKAKEDGIKMAIGSAAIMFNIDFVVDELHIRKYFDALISADEVRVSKPDPETFLVCAEKLGITPKDCLVFEDSPKGAEAAARAGMDCAVITSLHEKEDFEGLSNIVRFMKDYTAFNWQPNIHPKTQP